MGWKSTLDITRKEAIRKIEEADLDDLDDKSLAEILEIIMGGENHGHNYSITESQ